MPAIHQQGRTKVRDHIKTLVSHIGVATDQTAFGDGQTALDPANAGASERLIKASSVANVDADTFDATIDIDNQDASAEFENQTIWTIGAMDGSARTNNISRTVRSQGIGLQDGDFATVGVRLKIVDNT